VFGHAVERATIEDFTFHCLRHTFASWLTMKGAAEGSLGVTVEHN